MLVYHGGTETIETPLVTAGRDGLDFGRGFYLTVIKSQAVAWAERLADRRGKSPVVNIYELDLDGAKSKFKYKRFPRYDIEWLNFIANNRNGIDAWRTYDIIEGGVADDRVVDTVEGYISGLISAEKALERLSHYEPNNQICITRQTIADDYLKFIGSEIISNE